MNFENKNSELQIKTGWQPNSLTCEFNPRPVMSYFSRIWDGPSRALVGIYMYLGHFPTLCLYSNVFEQRQSRAHRLSGANDPPRAHRTYDPERCSRIVTQQETKSGDYTCYDSTHPILLNLNYQNSEFAL